MSRSRLTLEQCACLLAQQGREALPQGLIGPPKLLPCQLQSDIATLQTPELSLLFGLLSLEQERVAKLLEGTGKPVCLGAKRNQGCAAPTQPVAYNCGIVCGEVLRRVCLVGRFFALVLLQQRILVGALALGTGGAFQPLVGLQTIPQPGLGVIQTGAVRAVPGKRLQQCAGLLLELIVAGLPRCECCIRHGLCGAVGIDLPALLRRPAPELVGVRASVAAQSLGRSAACLADPLP